jgi:hypothetical protein
LSGSHSSSSSRKATYGAREFATPRFRANDAPRWPPVQITRSTSSAMLSTIGGTVIVSQTTTTSTATRVWATADLTASFTLGRPVVGITTATRAGPFLLLIRHS